MCQQPNFSIAKCCNSAINGKAISGAFNQERTPVGAFSVIVKTRWTFVSSSTGDGGRVMATYQGIAAALRLVIKTSRKLAVPQFPSHQHQPSSSQAAAAKQQPAVGHWCHIRTQPLLLHHSLRVGTFHFNCRQFCSFAIFCTFPQDSTVFSRNHHPSTHHYLIYHYYKYRNNCVFFPEENSSMLWYGVLLKSISSSNLLSIRQRRILQSPASRVTALRHY